MTIGNPSKITTHLEVDDPKQIDANYRFDDDDRQYLDNQVRGVQQHIAVGLINGAFCTYVLVDPGSPSIAVGDLVCLAGSLLGVPTVTKALAAALTDAKGVFGIAMRAAAPNAKLLVAIGGVVTPAITGLGASVGYVRANTATARCQVVGSFSVSDYVVGATDTQGYLKLGSGLPFSGALSGGTPGGANTTIQFNDAGVFNGAANLTYVNGGLNIAAAGHLKTNYGTDPTASAGEIRSAVNGRWYARHAGNLTDVGLVNWGEFTPGETDLTLGTDWTFLDAGTVDSTYVYAKKFISLNLQAGDPAQVPGVRFDLGASGGVPAGQFGTTYKVNFFLSGGNVSRPDGDLSDYGSGVGVAYIGAAFTNPSTNPTGGVVLWVDGGDTNWLKYRKPDGTVVTLNGGGGSSSGPVNSVQISAGGGAFLHANEVTAGNNYIALSGTPALTGAVRLGTGQQIVGRLNDNSADKVLVDWSTTDVLCIGATSLGASIVPALVLNGTGNVYTNINGITAVRVSAEGVGFGNDFNQWGSGSRVIAIQDASVVPSTNPTGGVVLYSEGGVLKYRKPDGSVISIGGGGGSSAGAVNTVQTSDGAGGFTAATNVLAGTDYLSIGTSPALTGSLRVGNAFTMKGRVGGVDHGLIEFTSSDLILGDYTNVANIRMRALTAGLATGGGSYYFLLDSSGIAELSGFLKFSGNAASAGNIRATNGFIFNGRNQANDGDIRLMELDSSNVITIGSNAGLTTNRAVTVQIYPQTTLALGVQSTTYFYASTSGAMIYQGLLHLGIAGASTPTLTKGTGAPAAAEPNGSIYLRTDGASGTGLYTRQGGAWYALSAGTSTPGGSNTQIQYNSSGTLAGASFLTTNGTSYLALGSTVPTTGALRVANDFQMRGRNAANGADIGVIGLSTSDNVVIGSNMAGSGDRAVGVWAYPSNNVGLGIGNATHIYITAGGVQMYNGVVQWGASGFGSQTGINFRNNTDGIWWRNAANGADIGKINVDSSNRMNIGEGAAHIRFETALGGNGQITKPLHMRVVELTLAANSNAVTLATGEYECPIIRLVGTGAVDKPIVFPNVDGAIWVVDNQSSNNVVCRVGGSGGTTIAAGQRGWFYCNGGNMYKVGAST